MNNPVDHGCSKLLVSNDLPPFAERKVCRQYQTLVLIAVGNHLEHQFGTHLVQLAIAPFVNDEKVQGPEVVRDHRFQPKNDHRFQPVQMSSNSTNIQNAVDSIFVSLSYLRQYGSVAEVHLSDYLVLSSVRLACKVEAIGSVEKTVQYALRKN